MKGIAMKRWLVGLVLVWVALAGVPQAAGTVTVASVNLRGNLVQYTVTWVSTAGGAVSGNAFSIAAGRLVSIRFTPDSGGTQPTDLYDVTLAETSGVADLTSGQGANLTNAAAVLVQWDPPLYQSGARTVDVVVANAGNAKGGTVVILVQTS